LTDRTDQKEKQQKAAIRAAFCCFSDLPANQ